MTAADLGSGALSRTVSDGSAAVARIACAHCELPVPAALVHPAGGDSFCCEGCRSVHELLHGCGLEQFYAVRAAVDAPGTPAPGASDDAARASDELAVFADPVFEAEHITELPDGTRRVELHLESVHCAACVWLVERLPRLVAGVLEARLSLATRTVVLHWDPARTTLPATVRGLARLGYPAHPVRDRDHRAARRRADRRTMVRIAVAGAVAGNVMLMAFALYGGHLHGMEPWFRRLFGGTSAVLTAVSLLWPGRIFYRGALAALRTRRPHLDLPIAVGLTAGFAWSVASTVRGSLDVYYDSIAVLVFLLLVGRWIQDRQQRRGHDAVTMLFAVAPATARRLVGDEPDAPAQPVPLEAVQRGDRLEVRTGDTVPVDGLVASGTSTVDEAMLTGESDPVPVQVGDRVHAGTTNLSGRLEVVAEATGDATRAGRLMDLVRRSAEDRAPVVQRADRIAAIFVPTVLVLAAATILIWWRQDPGDAVGRAMTLLIISCPCALGLATPLAIIAALGRAARIGILVTGGAALETLSRPGILVFDKTGTLTKGRRRVERWSGDPAALAAVAAIERASAHPIARAIVEHADADGGSPRLTPAPAATGVTETHGLGLTGDVGGAVWHVGRPDWVRSHATLPAERSNDVEALAAAGLSPVLAARNGRIVAAAGIGDPLQDDAIESVAALVARGWRCEILSGDDPAVVRRTGRRLGLPARRCRGGFTPEQKLDRVRRLSRRAVTVVVGDGVNDAAALSAATVGVAVKGGAEASLRAADVSLDRAGLGGVVELVDGAARTVRVIHRNLLVSLGYNVVGISLAFAGLIDPIVAAILMPVSSLTVITLSYRSRTFGSAEAAATNDGPAALDSSRPGPVPA